MASFVTVSELAAWLGKPEAELNSAQAELVLDVASDAIRSYCGWSITQEPVSDTYDGDGSPFLWLPTLRLVGVNAVTEDGVALTFNTDFSWSSHGRLLRAGCWSRGSENVAVSYTSGFPVVPGAVKAICLSLAARSLANPSGVRSHAESQGDWSESWSSAGAVSDGGVGPGLSLSELAELGPFRVPVVV